MANISRKSQDTSTGSGSIIKQTTRHTLPLAEPVVVNSQNTSPKSGETGTTTAPNYNNSGRKATGYSEPGGQSELTDTLSISPEGAEGRSASGVSQYDSAMVGGHQSYPETPEFPTDKKSDKNIWGMHPSAYGEPAEGGSESGIISSQGYAQSLVVDLWPAMPKFGGSGEEKGLQIFTLEMQKGVDRWHGILNQLADYIEDPSPPAPLRLAILNDVSIAEQWGHTFGETSFEGMMNVGSKMLQELKGISGHTTIRGMLSSSQDANSGVIKEIAGGSIEALDKIKGFLSGLPGSNKNLVNAAQQLLEGSKVDFPTIWQGSQFSPQYQLTCRLYNPDPTNPKMYKKYILTPLAYILAFACPTADSKFTYTFPLMVKARCAGLFYLPAGYVSSVQVVKGGDSMDLTFQQQPGMVDVRITLDSLYETMVASVPDQEGDYDTETTSGSTDLEDDLDRPTLKKYFGNMWDWLNFAELGKGNSNSGQVSSPGAGGGIVDTITSNLTNGTSDSVIPRIGDVYEDLSETLGTSLSSVGDIFTGALDGITSIADSMTSITGVVDGLLGGVTDAISGCIGGIDSIVNDIVSPITGVIDEFTSPIISGITDVLGVLDGDAIRDVFGLRTVFDSLSSLPDLPNLGNITSSINLNSLDEIGMMDYVDSLLSFGVDTINFDDSVLAGISSYAQAMIQNGTAPIPTLNTMLNSANSVNSGIQNIQSSISDCLGCCSSNILSSASSILDSIDLVDWVEDSSVGTVISSIGSIVQSMGLDEAVVDPTEIQSSANSMLSNIQSITSTFKTGLTSFKQMLTG